MTVVKHVPMHAEIRRGTVSNDIIGEGIIFVPLQPFIRYHGYFLHLLQIHPVLLFILMVLFVGGLAALATMLFAGMSRSRYCVRTMKSRVFYSWQLQAFALWC